MAASSRGFATPFRLELRSVDVLTLPHREIEFRKCRRRVSVDGDRIRLSRIRCCCSGSTGSGKSVEKAEEWRFDSKKSSHRVRIQAMPSMPFASPQWVPISLTYFLHLFFFSLFFSFSILLCVWSLGKWREETGTCLEREYMLWNTFLTISDMDFFCFCSLSVATSIYQLIFPFFFCQFLSSWEAKEYVEEDRNTKSNAIWVLLNKTLKF